MGRSSKFLNLKVMLTGWPSSPIQFKAVTRKVGEAAVFIASAVKVDGHLKTCAYQLNKESGLSHGSSLPNKGFNKLRSSMESSSKTRGSLFVSR